MTTPLSELCWPLDELDTAMTAFARKTGVGVPHNFSAWHAPGSTQNTADRLAVIASQLQIDLDEVLASYDTLPDLLRRGSPFVIKLTFGEEVRLLFIEHSGHHHCRVFSQTHETVVIANEKICSLMRAPMETAFRPKFQTLLEHANVASGKQEDVMQALLSERLGREPISGFWLVRLPPTRSFREQVLRQKLPRDVAFMLVAHGIQYALLLAGWWVIGKGALEGIIDRGWLVAWILLLAGQIPMQLATTWYQGHFSIGFGCLLKKRMLAGALLMDPGELRKVGTGQLLSRVIDSEAIESLALQGGFLSLLAFFELLLAALVLFYGAIGFWHVGLLVLFSCVSAWVFRRQFVLRNSWTGTRLRITQSLIEKLIGHRTRLAQEPTTRWHDGEDAQLSFYEKDSSAMDSSMAFIEGFLSRTWLVIGILALAPALFSPVENSAGIAIGLGGVLLAYRAISKGLQGLASLSTAAIAWKNVVPLFKQGSVKKAEISIPVSNTSADSEPLLRCRNLRFKYPNREQAAIDQCDFEIWRGDRILLQGESGSGKSTLLNLVTALYTRHTGVLLLNGLDLASMGATQWRRQIASAPQFHENHVLTETFAFNLLMGDQWPPRDGKISEALTICEELGLGELIERMPGGIMQMVGATGWQLSHGEKSRLFIARSLLQESEIVILDESFAALDPINLRRAVECVQKRAKTLLVVAHP